MENKRSLQSLSDDELLHRLAELLRQSRRVESDLVAHIGEVDDRRLYAREASSSMFAYCTEVLHLSDAEAYLRIAAARAARAHPMLLAMLGDGRLHLTGIAKLAPHLTPDNSVALLKRATHLSKRQIEELVAELAPRPDVPAVIRKLPEKTAFRPAIPFGRDPVVAPVFELRPDGVPAPARVQTMSPPAQTPFAQPSPMQPSPALPAPAPPAPVQPAQVQLAQVQPAQVQPLAVGRYKVQFTASAELRDKLERLQALMRSEVPDGDLAAIIERAVTEKLERLDARRIAKTKAPRKALSETKTLPSSRHVPAAVRRVVSVRDGNRCRYVDEQGRRCTARDRLELHHRH
ncbi:MAG TPA: hypothetical protein VMV21_01980, partial [Vicinamibacteria bacterium]|nr:hypothetical protein [Vicinamibacteria bacterium]